MVGGQSHKRHSWGSGVANHQILFGMMGSWWFLGLHEILYPIMYRNMSSEHSRKVVTRRHVVSEPQKMFPTLYLNPDSSSLHDSHCTLVEPVVHSTPKVTLG